MTMHNAYVVLSTSGACCSAAASKKMLRYQHACDIIFLGNGQFVPLRVGTVACLMADLTLQE
jgi:hypothetical protein